MDKCGQSEDFRLAVKRTRPKTLHEAVLNAMQEECLRVGEGELLKDHKAVHRQMYEIGTEMGKSNFKVATGTAKPPNADEGFPGTKENLRIPGTCRYEKRRRRGALTILNIVIQGNCTNKDTIGTLFLANRQIVWKKRRCKI